MRVVVMCEERIGEARFCDWRMLAVSSQMVRQSLAVVMLQELGTVICGLRSLVQCLIIAR